MGNRRVGRNPGGFREEINNTLKKEEKDDRL